MDRIDKLIELGFEQKRGCITNGNYSFLYHQVDEMLEYDWLYFIKLVDMDNSNKLIKKAHSEITRRKGQEYAPNVYEIQNHINIITKNKF